MCIDCEELHRWDNELSYSALGRLQDKIEVLECREKEYQKLIRLGITLITVKDDLLEGLRHDVKENREGGW